VQLNLNGLRPTVRFLRAAKAEIRLRGVQFMKNLRLIGRVVGGINGLVVCLNIAGFKLCDSAF